MEFTLEIEKAEIGYNAWCDIGGSQLKWEDKPIAEIMQELGNYVEYLSK